MSGYVGPRFPAGQPIYYEAKCDVSRLRLLADARREYAHTGDADCELIRHEAEVMDNIADALDGTPWVHLVESYAPSWRWSEFGEHNPTPGEVTP